MDPHSLPDPDTVACQKIIEAKSPFECFEITARETDPSIVRSLYLKIAVKVHPDKNTSHLATQAFQILSESFEALHDEDKQFDLLRHPSSSSSAGRLNSHRKKKKKRKPQDIADLVHQNDKWYTRDWKEVEAEIERMTNEFKEHLARKQEKHEKQSEKRAERRERKNKRIKKNLNFLYEKYGIDPSDSDSSDQERNTYNYVSYIPETPECHSLVDKDRTNSDVNVSEAPSTSSKSKESICTLCRRSFTSDAMLTLHYEKSELHRSNAEKAANPWHKFKKSFSEVKDT